MFKFLSLLLLISPLCLLAQDSTLEPQKESSKEYDTYTQTILQEYKNVLIVPFEPKLYRSDIDREIYKETGLAPSQIKYNLRKGLSDMMFLAIKEAGGNPVSLLENNEQLKQDLGYIYNSIGYKYIDIPEEEKQEPENVQEKVQEKATAVFNKVKAQFEPQKPEPGTRLENGQIVSNPHTTERFMATKVFNPTMLNSIGKVYGAGYFVFINELDIKIAPGTSQHAIASELYQREIKVHYSIIDINGKEVYSAAAKEYFSSKNNDLNKIVKSEFSKISNEIASHIPTLVVSKEEQKLIQLNKQKSENQRKELEGTYR